MSYLPSESSPVTVTVGGVPPPMDYTLIAIAGVGIAALAAGAVLASRRRKVARK